jgi:DUF971 family protein
VAIASEAARRLAALREAPDSAPPEPVKVDVSDPSTTTISWNDGAITSYAHRPLRALCPCATCVDENTGKRIVTLEQIDPNVRATAFEIIGRYAIRFAWSDGHSTGLYSFDLLRKLG